jgi:TP901 family phage tail tape measure protein
LAKVSVQVNFTATANFAPLRAEISSLNGVYKTIAKGNTSIQRTGAAGAKATGGIRDAAVKAQGPLGQMQQTIDRNNMSFTRMISTIKKSNAIVGEHVAMQNAKANAIKMSNGSYKVQISLVNTLTTRMKMLSGQIGVATAAFRAMGSWMIKTGKNIQWAGRQIMVGLGVPLILLATAANRAAESYIKEMTRVVKVTTLSAASGTAAFARQEESVRRQTRVLVELGATMGFVADETAGMVAEFAQMGFAGRSLDLVADASLRLSRVSGADLDTSLQLTRITAQAFGIELDKLTETFAKLNLIENNTSLSLADMAEALPVVAGVANAVGLSIEQTSGFMAMMKDAGISAKEGATALRTGLIRIVSDATEPARKAFSDIGLSIDDMKKRVADGGGDLMIFFEELGDKLNNIQGDQQKMNDFTNAIGKLTGVRQAARFVTFLKEIPNAQKAIAVGQKAMKDALDDGADFSTALQVAKNAQDELMAGLSDTSGARAFIGVWADSVVATRQFERELENVNNSLTGVAERLRAEINVELAKVGE